MRRKLKGLAIIIGSIFLLFFILTAVLNRFLSEERLKAMLVKPVQRELGREVTLGSVDVSLLSGITITDIGIKELNSKQNFISIKTFRLSYELLPLLQKKLVIKEALLDEPQIKIIRERNGRFNFSDIGQNRNKREAELIPTDGNTYDLEPIPLNLIFSRVNINKAVLTLTDKTNVLPEVFGEADLTLRVLLGKTLADLKFNGEFNFLANSEYRGHKPVLQIACTIDEKLISYNGNLTVGFDEIDVTGWVANYFTSPEIKLNAAINTLDLDKLASLKQFISNNSEQQAPAPFQTEQQDNASPSEKEDPAKLNVLAHGKVNIGEISSGLTKIKELGFTFQLEDNIITLNKIVASIFDGVINGDASADISMEQPVFQGKIKGDGIKVSGMMASFKKPPETLSGLMAINLSFQGSGKEWSVIQKSLNGEGTFTLIDGGIRETPLTTALALLLDIPELNDLRFNEASGFCKIDSGKVLLESNLQGHNVNILTNGTIGLDGSLNMPLTLQLSPGYSKKLARKASFTKYLTDQQGRTTLHLQGKGSVHNPRLTLDGSGAKQQAAKAIEKKITGELVKAIKKNQPAADKDSDRDPVKDMSEMLFKQLTGN